MYIYIMVMNKYNEFSSDISFSVTNHYPPPLPSKIKMFFFIGNIAVFLKAKLS